MPEKILVIKLGALGDVVLACGPFEAIRKHHAGAKITLLTTKPYENFLHRSNWFDEIITDSRPSIWKITEWIDLRNRLLSGSFDRVYDLQTSDRSGWYYRLLGPSARPEWSGIVWGCSHPHNNRQRDNMHTIDRHAEQLAIAGIECVPKTQLSWVKSNIETFGLPSKYALLVAGGSPHRHEKRWPTDKFVALARRLDQRGVTPVFLGGCHEREISKYLLGENVYSFDLIGKTSLEDIVTIARGAACAVGNDTGPMHLIAASDCPTVVLFSAASDFALTSPRGSKVTILQRDDLSKLAVEKVDAALSMR